MTGSVVVPELTLLTDPSQQTQAHLIELQRR